MGNPRGVDKSLKPRGGGGSKDPDIFVSVQHNKVIEEFMKMNPRKLVLR